MNYVNRKGNPGFSIIEIMVVIGIGLGLMAAVAVMIRSNLAKSKRKRTEMTLRQTEEAITMFQNDLDVYPASLEDLVTKPVDEKLAKKWGEPYMPKVPKDGWGNELQYQLNPKGSAHPYELYSWGPKGESSPDEEHISVWDL